MPQPFHNFNPAKVLFNWSLLTSPLTGYGEGTFIKAARDNQAFKKKGGADGEYTRVQNRSRGGHIEVTLKQGAAANSMLSLIFQADENFGTGVGPVSLIDMSGPSGLQTLAAAVNCWIRAIPEITLNAEDEEVRVWIFDTDTLEMFVGQN